MTPLPNDYARCAQLSECALSKACRRTVPVPPGAYRQVASVFPGGSDCYGYIGEQRDDPDMTESEIIGAMADLHERHGQ